MSKKDFFERFIAKLDSMDKNNIQAYVLRLARERGFLETVFNTIHEGIIVIDRHLKIRYVNKAATKLLGLPENVEDQLISRFLKDIDWKRITHEDEDEWYRISRQEIEVLYPRRSVLLFYLVPHGVATQGNATIILHDVTESRQKEIDTIESEKMHLMSLLAAGVAHEIGNPLNSLHIHLQLLERHLAKGEKKDSEASELLTVSKHEVERLDTIITQFLQAIRYSRPDLIKLDIKQLIIETLNFIRHEIEDRSIQVKCSFPDFLPHIYGDENQLKQAFYNIIKNAIQAMPEGGSLDISCLYDDNYVEIAFADTGKGIPIENIGNIFEPYYTTKRDGSGLGLMIVERIIREHGAALSVESKRGEGAIFTMRFPRSTKRIRMLPAPVAEDIKADIINQKKRHARKD